MKKNFVKNFPAVLLMVLSVLAISLRAEASGLFGPLQTVSREQGGLNTAIGYLYHEDTYKNGESYKIKQNEIYSQAAYGAKNIWEVYARIGVSNMKIAGIFASSDHFVETSQDDFEADWKFFGTLGAKAFYPINEMFGVGAFLQGTYYFSDFSDHVAITSGGVPVRTEMKFENLRDAVFGVGLQAKLPCGTNLYAGPYLYYSEADLSLFSGLYGTEYAEKHYTVKNKSLAGGFAGAEIPLIKGFRLNLEGQFADRFSAGAAISYTY
ncbi:MAG TPA: hypothetical protein PLV50_00240 [Smithella sp.]|nr:hypothetical protein [Smithella sp.]HOG88934.1 hypothetical protein [Smithella sp.]HQI71824.1 hypothetical protein [Smithella sp.]